MAHLIANTFIQLLRKDIQTSPVVGKKQQPMAIASKSERNDKESLNSNFFCGDVKNIFYYFTFFSEEECYFDLSADIVE
jgi:hypothetical protein